MTYVSPQAFELALQSARRIENHGKRFEKTSELLKESALTEFQSEFIKLSGQQIQYQGQAMRVLVEQALQEDEQCQLEKYILIHRHHCQVVIDYIASVECLLQTVRLLLMSPSSDFPFE